MGDDHQLQQQIADIGVRFVKRTIGEVAQLRAYLDSARCGSLDSLKELERLAHKISGSGAMFGFDELSERASQIERLASTGRTNSTSLDRIEDSLRALEGQVDKAAREGGFA